MEAFELKGELRKEVGKKAAKALRKEETVPCVIYGNGEENVNFYVAESDLRDLIYTPKVYIVNVKIGRKSYQTVMREIQFHPVSDKVLHIDFYRILKDKPVVIEVPVKLEGFAAGVKVGGKLVQVMRKLKVRALPADLPDEINIDVTSLELGKSIKVKELHFDKYEIVNSKEVVVANVRVTRDAKAAMATTTTTPEEEG